MGFEEKRLDAGLKGINSGLDMKLALAQILFW